MRSDPLVFSYENESASKRPRFVIAIEYDVESIYLTSHAGISGIPGVHIENVLRRPSAISQRIVPDEGRSEIGSFQFSLVDLNRAFTEEIRDKLGDGKGLRGKKVRFYVGYQHMFKAEGGGFGTWGETFGYGTGTTFDTRFSEFQLFQTQIVVDASYEDGIYDVKCADITREQRKDIFEPKTTTLRDTISASATTVPVYSTVGFQPVWHTSSFSDAPSTKVGYIKIDKEWIRYTGFTADSFTGCTRGVLNTKAVEHTVDAATDADRRPKVEEGIYLEMPAVKLAYAILTGRIYGTSPLQTLPPHWHLGIDPDLVRLSDFTGIGDDLWDTSLDTNGFVTRFQGLSKIDGKKFLENELYMLLGCYSPIYSDGTIGLKRMNQVLANAAYVVELSGANVIKHGALNHEFSGMHNRLQIDWNWNGERFTRTTLFIDANSVAIHGEAPLKKLQFKGLHGSRHTEAIIRKRLDAFRDRYTSPPETTTVDVLSSLNRLEVGDIVRDRMPNVRDWNGTTNSIDRSFEIQRKSLDFATGDVRLDLFGSTAAASENAPNDTGSGAALPDAFYGNTGTDLTTVTTISVVGGVGVIQAGTYNLAAGTYYYLGDLELANGATLTINGTVQIHARGFFTINGAIDGVGRGKAGQADSGGILSTVSGLSGFLGNSRGMDGLIRRGGRIPGFWTVPCAFTQGDYAAFPYLEITVSGTDILGIPSDLAGTSGGAGGKAGYTDAGSLPEDATVAANGGTGGDSGAGLVIISRGLAFGASGEIDLSGDDSASTSPVTIFGASVHPGAGGAGAPGALLILLDGSSVSVPDLGGKFTAACGTVPVDGNPLPQRSIVGPTEVRQALLTEPYGGYLDESMISAVDLSNVAYRIQYIPQQETPEEDADDLPPAPTSLSVTGTELANVLTIGLPPVELFDVVEIYASITSNRSDAVNVGEVKANTFRHQLPGGATRAYWVRTKRGLPNDAGNVYSSWLPESATGGIISTTQATITARGNCEVHGDVIRKVGGSSAWDSDAYSPTIYRNGAFLSFRPDQTNASVMVALNSDPTTDQNYTSLDYAWYLTEAGGAEIFESGTQIAVVGAYTTASVFTIKHDGKFVRYEMSGQLIRQTPVTSATLFFDTSFYTPGGQISHVMFGPLSEIASSPWIARGNCIAGVSTASKSGGSSAWDSDIYSIDRYPACFLKFKPSQTNGEFMLGFNTDPQNNQSYDSIDYGWVVRATGILEIWESNTQQVSNAGSYTTSTELAMTYDGSNVRYYIDRVLTRTVAIASQTFFADASFYTPGAAVNSLRFGPGTSLEAVGTPGIEDEAVTESVVSEDANDLTLGTIADLASAQIVVPTGQTWRLSVEASATIDLGASPSGACRLYENGVQVQENKGWNSNMANQEIHPAFTHVVDLGAGTHTFAIRGFNSSGGATKRDAIVKITGLKK